LIVEMKDKIKVLFCVRWIIYPTDNRFICVSELFMHELIPARWFNFLWEDDLRGKYLFLIF